MMLGLEFETTLVPVAERGQIAVLQLATFWRAGRTGSVEQDEEVGRIDGNIDRLANRRQLLDVFRQQHVAFVFVHDVAQRLISNEQFGGSVLNHEVQTLGGITRVERLIGATCFQHTEGGNGHPLTARNENRHNILSSKTFRNEICCHTLRDVVHFAVGVFVFVINHRHVVGRQFHLTAEQRNDGLRRVVRHLGLVETIEESSLIGIQQRHLLQLHFRLTDEGIGRIADRLCQTLHRFVAIASFVVLQAHARLARRVVHDEEGEAELRSIRLEELDGNRLAFVLVVFENAHLIGKQNFGGEVVVGGDACKRIRLVLQRFVEVLTGFVEEFQNALFTNLGTQRQRIDEHTHRVLDAQVGTSVADGGDTELLVVGEARQRVERCGENVVCR